MQEGIRQSLVNRFKEFNRVKKSKSQKPKERQCSVVKTEPTTKKPFLYEVPGLKPGEDEHSYERHCQKIKLELKKKTVNQVVLNSLAELTFPTRRKDILTNSDSVKTIFSKYPHLHSSPEQV